MKPMLAFKFNDKKHLLTYPCYIQPKLNGIRMLYQNQHMQSRSYGKDTELLWSHNRLLRLRENLSRVSPDFVLDGELYHHSWSLQKINSAAAVNRLTDTEDTDRLEYHIFDCFIPKYPLTPFSERLDYLNELISYNITHCRVETVNVLTEAQAEPYYTKWRSAGYEGMMYRQASSPYGHSSQCTNQENRWPYLLKRKDWLDDEFTCIGFEYGLGKYTSMVGALVLELPNGQTFNAGSGLSDMERQQYADSPPIGHLIKVKYEMLSDAGIPLKPTILCVL